MPEIIVLFFKENMCYDSTLTEPSQRDGSNEGLQHILYEQNVKLS